MTLSQKKFKQSQGHNTMVNRTNIRIEYKRVKPHRKVNGKIVEPETVDNYNGTLFFVHNREAAHMNSL